MSDVLRPHTTTTGHTHVRPRCEGEAVQVNGDIGSPEGQLGSEKHISHKYIDATASGTAKQVNGNVLGQGAFGELLKSGK